MAYSRSLDTGGLGLLLGLRHALFDRLVYSKLRAATESIKRIRVLSVDFTEETGELTPTLKVKRH